MNNSDNYFEKMITDEDRELIPYLETIPALLEKCSKDYKDKRAISDDKQSFTYLELLENVKKRINLLERRNIGQGAHVAVICRNNADAMCWLLAIPSSGRVLMMLPCGLTAEMLETIVDFYDIEALIAESCFTALTNNLNIPVIDAADCSDELSDFGDVKKDTTAAIYLTGGSTGRPKGVVLSHGALMRGAKNGIYKPSAEVFDNISIVMLPLSHIFGTVTAFLSCLYTGSEIYGCKDVKSGITMVPRIKPTLLVLVPGIVEIILNLAKLKGAEFLGDLRTIQCGGAPVPKRLIKEAKKYNINLYPGYGMTEGANLTSANVDLETKPHSMGKIYPLQEAKIVEGELWIRGDNLMKGYYKDPEATKKVLTKDGWFKTGDLASFDEEGFITIIGRKDNLIILPSGENISPEELEDIFNRSDLIQDCLVKESLVNNQSVLSIEILPLANILAQNTWDEVVDLVMDEVKKINETLPAFKQINNVVVRKEDFKRTPALKIDRLKEK